MARLGWLPGQAKLPLHDGWQRTRKPCHSSWNVKSTIKKAKPPQHKPASPWENWSLPTSLQLHFFALHSLHLGPFRLCELVAVPKVVILTQLPFAVEMWAQMGQITNTAWQNTRAKLPVQLWQWHPCEHQDQDATTRWLASNLTDVPVATRCRIDNQKSKASPTQTWITLGKRKTDRYRYLQLRSFTFFALHDLYSGSCAKVVILTQLLSL